MDYRDFLHWLYAKHPGLENQSYREQMEIRTRSLFGTVDFYSRNLNELGHEAQEIYVNNEFMQKAWAREHDIRIEGHTPTVKKSKKVLHQLRVRAGHTRLYRWKPLFSPLIHYLSSQEAWFHSIIEAQIGYYKPDILLNHAVKTVKSSFLVKIKPYVRLLAGQVTAVPFPESEDWQVYKLIITTLPSIAEWFRQKGIPAEINHPGFDPEILNWLGQKNNSFDITFVGGLGNVHGNRMALLESLCGKFEQMKIWAPNIAHLPCNSRLRKHCIEHEAWGIQMYQILNNSKITLNCHGDDVPYAGNMRLFEATGVGTFLITDWKVNLHKMFEPGKEVVAYHSHEECAELIKYYLEHDEERDKIAQAGQKRTLRDHTYNQRMQELVEIVRKYL
jgi:hypothetical protein